MIDQTIVDQAREISVLHLARERAPLNKESTKEWSGPCPKCGGDDRFHVTETGFFCRQCHPEFGDAIEYMRWLHRLNFADAVHMLTYRTSEPAEVKHRSAPKTPKPTPQPADWQARTLGMVELAQNRVEYALGYLQGRGLTAETAIRYKLGFRPDAPLPGTWKDKKLIVDPKPAVVIPWYRNNQLVAVRYRFLSLHEYIDADGRERKVKQSSVYDSNFSGLLYGGHVLPDFCFMPVDPNGKCAEQYRTLVLCEGEINAMSIHQTTHTWRWDVLSLGSETQRLTDGGRAFASRYGQVIVWMDKPEIAQEITSQIAGSVAIASPEVDGQQMDANAMLQAGRLDEFLAAARQRACTSDEKVTQFMWDLWDAYYA